MPALDEHDRAPQLATLTGRITQIPPAYSAIKRGGERLYKRARRGETSWPVARSRGLSLRLSEAIPNGFACYVECGSGTYCAAWSAISANSWVAARTSVRCAGFGSSLYVVRACTRWHELRNAAVQGVWPRWTARCRWRPGLTDFRSIRVTASDATRLRQGQLVPGSRARGRLLALDGGAWPSPSSNARATDACARSADSTTYPAIPM